MAKKLNKLKAALKKDIPSAYDMKTGVDMGKGKKTMPKGMPKKVAKGGGKMPIKSMMKGKKSC